MWVDKPSGGHRGGHTRSTGITRIKFGNTSCRQIGETFGLDRVAAPAKGLGCVRPNAAAMRDGVHQGRVVPSAPTYDKATDVSRQQGDSPSDRRSGKSGQQGGAILNRQPVGEMCRKIKAVKRFGEGRAEIRMLKQRRKASLIDRAGCCDPAAHIHLAEAVARDPVIDRRIRRAGIKREKPAVPVTPGDVPDTAQIDNGNRLIAA